MRQERVDWPGFSYFSFVVRSLHRDWWLLLWIMSGLHLEKITYIHRLATFLAVLIIIWLQLFSSADKHRHVPSRGLPTLWLRVWFGVGSRSLVLTTFHNFPETLASRFVPLKITGRWSTVLLFSFDSSYYLVCFLLRKHESSHGQGECYHPWATLMQQPCTQTIPDQLTTSEISARSGSGLQVLFPGSD